MKVGYYFPPRRWWIGHDKKSEPMGVTLSRTLNALEETNVERVKFDKWDRDQDFDILHVDGAHYEVETFVKSATSIDMPVVVRANDYSRKPLWKWKLWKRIDPLIPVSTVYGLRQSIYDEADIVMSSSPSMTSQLLQRFDIDERKMRFVPQGVDAERFAQADESLFRKRYELDDFVLQVGRIDEWKGQKRLLRALDGTDLEAVFVGPMTPVETIEVAEKDSEFLEMVEERSWAHYIGELNHDDPLLPSAYAAASVHALPSKAEILGLVTLEASAANCAAVSGRYGPIHDYLGDDIWYCDPVDVDSIRRAVTEAYEEGPASGVSKLIAEQYSWGRVADEIVSIYHELV